MKKEVCKSMIQVNAKACQLLVHVVHVIHVCYKHKILIIPVVIHSCQ